MEVDMTLLGALCFLVVFVYIYIKFIREPLFYATKKQDQYYLGTGKSSGHSETYEHSYHFPYHPTQHPPLQQQQELAARRRRTMSNYSNVNEFSQPFDGTSIVISPPAPLPGMPHLHAAPQQNVPFYLMPAAPNGHFQQQQQLVQHQQPFYPQQQLLHSHAHHEVHNHTNPAFHDHYYQQQQLQQQQQNLPHQQKQTPQLPSSLLQQDTFFSPNVAASPRPLSLPSFQPIRRRPSDHEEYQYHQPLHAVQPSASTAPWVAHKTDGEEDKKKHNNDDEDLNACIFLPERTGFAGGVAAINEGPAQIQIEVARKARIPLFVQAPMMSRKRSISYEVSDSQDYTREHGGSPGSPLEGFEAAQQVPTHEAQQQPQQGVRQPVAPASTSSYQHKIPELMNEKQQQQQKLEEKEEIEEEKEKPWQKQPKSKSMDESPNRLDPSRIPTSDGSNLHIDFHDIKMGRLIGQGAFGAVHIAVWRGTQVAVKMLVHQQLSQDILNEFESEVQIMTLLRHPNIVMLMGACLLPPHRCLVVELVAQGSLWSVLRQPLLEIGYDRQRRFCLDTAQGMNYLHSFKSPILHRDLKSPNLLVDNSFNIKISDFGLARVRAHFQTMTGNCGTVQWMAPEVLAAQKYTEKADVFSFAVVCWETVTRACPYDGLSAIQVALGVLNNNLRPTIPTNCPPLLRRLMSMCWSTDPERRPTFEKILELLHE